MRVAATPCVLVLTMTVIAAFAWEAGAQSVDGSRGERPLPPRSHPYRGVAPGSGNPPPVGPAPRKRGTAVTWPGFQLRDDGGSRFFLQTNGRVDLRTTIQPQQVVVILERIRIVGRNNRRPLVTRFFDTPVTSARLKPRGKHAAFVMKLRRPAQPTVSQTQTASGYHYVLVEFPAP